MSLNKLFILVPSLVLCLCLLSACSAPGQESDPTQPSTEPAISEPTVSDPATETTGVEISLGTTPEETTESETTVTTEVETEPETEPDPLAPMVTYHSIPLLGKDDTTGRLAIMDHPDEAQKSDLVVFQILPTDTSNGKYVDAHTLLTPADSHILVLSCVNKADGVQSLIVLQESTSTRVIDSGEELRTVDANCYRLAFFSELTPINLNHSAYSTTFDGAGHTFSYTEATKFTQMAVVAPVISRVPKNAESLLRNINTTDYDVTVLYACEGGEVQINTPVTELPAFSWDILKKYANIK